jgi:hypothetical protein
MLRGFVFALAVAAAAALAPGAFPAAPAAAAMASATALTAPAFPATPTQVSANGNGNGCTGFTSRGGWWVSCQAGGSPGAAAGGGGPQKCTWSANVNQFFPNALHFLPKVPGSIYLVEVCGQQFFPPVLVANGGAVTPAALAQQALRELRPPLPIPQTAPPRASGHGLVGVPEWFWVPQAQWAPVTARVAVGAVWAAVTATPHRLTFSPGGGIAAQSCPGPGTAYNKSVPASTQNSACKYTYTASSATQPGAAYQVTVTITWTATWQGSGGAGGALAPLTTSASFPLRVDEGQALNTRAGT